MNRCLLLSCVASLCLSACVENDEEIAIHANGSASVHLSAKGKPEDLSDGYPIPLHGPWIPEGKDTATWLRFIGPDTGSALTRANLAAIDEVAAGIDRNKDLRLDVRAEFASVRDMPNFLAPAAEPYRTAYLERGTNLSVDTKSGRRVFTFERTYRARRFERVSLWDALEHGMPGDLKKKVEAIDDNDKEARLDVADRAQLVDFLLSTLVSTSMPHAEDALASIYTAGDAGLDPRSVPVIQDGVRQALAQVVTRERVARLVEDWSARTSGEDTDDDIVAAIARIEVESREALRTSLDAALTREDVPLATRNAIRGQLEWNFTAYDHTTDLGDEDFRLTVEMPGIVVGGNFDEREDSRVHWKFDGEALRDRDRVLRVVSVLD